MTRASPRTPQEDLDLIQSFASGDPRTAQAARFADWFHWRPSAAVRCPRTVAGKRCRTYHYAKPCVCQRLHYPLLDHTRMWLTDTGERVLTAEPYHFDGEDFAELVAECKELGLDVSVRGISPYFPGRAVLIIIRNRGGRLLTELTEEIEP